MGSGWCRSDVCDESPCKVNGYYKDESNPDECRRLCLKESSCTGYAISTPQFDVAPNRCFIHGNIAPTDNFSTNGKWNIQSQYLVPTTTDGGVKRQCWQRKGTKLYQPCFV